MLKIKLRDELFRLSFETGKAMIKRLDCDRLLAPCFEAMGKEPKKERYGGWEARGISGHTLGHYMSALSYLYDFDGDKWAYETAFYCIDTLASLQGENGYISGFPEKDSFDNVFGDVDNFKAEGFELGGWWVPYYSLHKIFRGMLDIYEYMHYDKALEVSRKLGQWVSDTTKTLNEEQRLRLLKCEYGGMNDALARLYAFTNDSRFLIASRFFSEEKILEPLSRGEDKLTSLHANTQIPKVIGAMTLYEVAGEEKMLKAAENFFDFVTRDRSYAIGGHSISEHFEECGRETLATNTCETCNTNNMLQLCHKLWLRSHRGDYADFAEKALVNHILASQDETGMKTYFVGMKPGNHKVYSTPEDSFWCCFGSGLENPFTYGRFICDYDKKIYINLYVPCEAENEDISFILSETEEGSYALEFRKDYVGSVCLRKPVWCKDFRVKIGNGEYTENENGYVTVCAEFEKGAKIEISAPRNLCVHKKKDDENIVYFTYGEKVLAERIEGEMQKSDHAAGENDFTNQLCPDCEKLKSVEVKKTGNDEFSVDSHTLVPFYSIVHGRYRVYFETE